MSKVPVLRALQRLVMMTEVISGQSFKTLQNITQISWSEYFKYCNCSKIFIKYKTELTYLIFFERKNSRDC